MFSYLEENKQHSENKTGILRNSKIYFLLVHSYNNNMANTLPENILVTSDIKLEFNDRIASLPIFLCERCSRLLKFPIMLLKNVGNICEDCAHSEDAEAFMVRNLALEIVLQNLEVSCRNISSGCQKKLGYFDMLTHDLICTYNDSTCPTHLVTNCDWQGYYGDIVLHVSTGHQDL
ncbi:hypothetical protein ILUMI_10212, partial [Ignelater luminosus]